MINILKKIKYRKLINLKNKCLSYLKQSIEYLKNDTIFIYFLIGALSSSTLLRFLTVRNYFEIRPIIGDIIFIMLIGMLSYTVKQKRRFNFFLIWSIIIAIIAFINSVYYTFYNSFVSVSLLSTSIFVIEVGDAVVKNVISPKDILFFSFPIIFFIINTKKFRSIFYKKQLFIMEGKRAILNMLVIVTLIFIAFTSSLTPVDYSRFNKQWNREFLVTRFGLYIYQLNDIIKSIEPQINTMFGYDRAVRYFREFYAERQNQEPIKNKYTNIFKGKNIIAIHAESVQSFAMGLKFNGLEVTPNLNRIAKEGIHFTNFYTQVGVGTSSDTEFTLNTSLLPVSNGTVFVSYWDREFVTIPKLLNELGYYSFSMHGNNGTFWNRLVMHEEMGYDKFYHKSSFVIDEEIGLGLSDKSFFRQSIPIIKSIVDEQKKPFYATMIMLTNHTPFDEVDKYGYFPVDYKVGDVSYPYMEGTIMGRYLKAVRYADAAIGEFISGLDAAGLLENTVVVIYGDHDARLPRNDFVRLYNYDYTIDGIMSEEDPRYKKVDFYQYELDRKVPFIIWTKDTKFNKKVNTVMGMADVLPTLGNMFGFYSPYQLGNDIFNLRNNIVVFPNSNWLTNNVYYNSQKREYKILKDKPLSEDYITKHSELADSLLEVSNSIILYDLIRRERELEIFLKENQ